MKPYIVIILLSYLALNQQKLMAFENINPVYENEKQITFTSNQGETTLAFEGIITVPENHYNAMTRSINLKYVRFPSTSSKPGSPIVYLSGGPGGSGITTAQDKRFPIFQALRAQADVIALDQRGTGKSNDVKPCISSQPSIHIAKMSMAQISSSYRLAAQECLAQWQSEDIDIYGYTTVQNAMDLDYVRNHLNANKITLWGISYGSHLAMAASKILADKIDRIIIASAEGLDQTVKLPANTDAYFQQIEDVINASPEYVKLYPELIKTMRRVHEKLDAKPIAMTFQARGKEQKILFQKWHMQQIASMVISDPGPYMAILFNIYYQLDQDKTGLLAKVLTMGLFTQDNITLNLMSLAMDVASGITPQRLKLVNKQAEQSLLGSWLNFPMPQLNLLDNKLDLGDEFRTDPSSDIPLLLFTGTLDGRTYPASQYKAVAGYNNKTIVTIENAGHNLYMTSPKVTELMLDFLDDKAIETELIKLPNPQFVMPDTL